MAVPSSLQSSSTAIGDDAEVHGRVRAAGRTGAGHYAEVGRRDAAASGGTNPR
jgi:hypothetical protein